MQLLFGLQYRITRISYHALPELSKIPVIICSGVTRYKELFSRDHKTMPKPFAFIEKPIDKDLLIRKIKEAIG